MTKINIEILLVFLVATICLFGKMTAIKVQGVHKIDLLWLCCCYYNYYYHYYYYWSSQTMAGVPELPEHGVCIREYRNECV